MMDHNASHHALAQNNFEQKNVEQLLTPSAIRYN